MSASAFRAMLEAGDVEGLRKAWAELSPHLPQPQSHDDAEIVMHRARTSADTVAFKHRAYSHAWLEERALPSGLPDELKPQAERLYPRTVSAVGISLTTKNEFIQPIIGEVQSAMEYAVLEAEGDGKLTDDAHVRTRMREAHKRTFKLLLGR